MRIVNMTSLQGRRINAFGSDGLRLHALVRGGEDVHVAALTLPAGGAIGRHPAPVDQCLFLTAGMAHVHGADHETGRLEPGWAAVWVAGETHGASSAHGCTGLLVEAPGLAAAFAREPGDSYDVSASEDGR